MPHLFGWLLLCLACRVWCGVLACGGHVPCTWCEVGGLYRREFDSGERVSTGAVGRGDAFWVKCKGDSYQFSI